MPRVTLNQTNFTAGEVSPKCYGRVDVTRYQNGAKSLENCLVGLHGGARRRPGSVFIASTKDHTKRSRLIPFIFSTTQAYMLEFGHNYIRVYVQGGGQVLNGSGQPYEIPAPYSDSMLADLDFTQGADTMFIFHEAFPIQTLKRLASDSWALQTAPITVAPFDEIGHRVSAALTISNASVGTGRTVTAPSGTFIAGDVGRRLTYLSGIALITGFNSGTSVAVEVLTSFPTTIFQAGKSVIEDSPQTSCTPSAKDPVGSSITLSSTVDTFRGEDIGKFVRINGGLVQITGYSSSQSVSAKIKQELTSVVASPASAWSLEASVWNNADGYPRSGALYEQRLVAAGSPKYPQTKWGSRSGLFFDFTLGTNDDDAFSFTLPSTGQINPILRLASTKCLIALTYGGEHTMQGGIEKPLIPTNVQAKNPSTYGAKNIKPVRVGNELLFVQRAGKKIRAFSYRLTDDEFKSPDLTVLAEHITRPGITDMAYQQEPDSILWCVRADGKLATLTLDREEGVTAWTPLSTDGVYESIASIPNEEGDEVWCIVRRTINGQTRRYVERFEEGYYTDCAITGSDATGKPIWTGLGHLEGKEVAVRADGTYIGKFTVTSGQIELDRNAKVVEIGLPFTNRVTLLRPEVQAGDATAQSNAQRVHQVALLLMDTIGVKVNGNAISFRQFGGDLLDVAPTPYSGFKSMGLTEWTRGDQEITISQDEPNPFHLLSVIRKFTVNS